MGSHLLAKQIPGAAVLRRSVGEDGFDDSGGLMSDSCRIRGMVSTSCQVVGILIFGASWEG
jgi:hypothetical protein